MPHDQSYWGERVLMRRVLLFVLFVLLFAGAGLATVFGTVRGIVHDPQHRPVSGIEVVLKAKASEFTLNTRTDDAGQFHFDPVPLAEYTVAVADANFMADKQTLAFLPTTPPTLETQRGSYSADHGDRTYGVFNVYPRPGFERSNEAEIVLSAGNFYQTDDQLNFGSHTNRFAYYASLSGNRTNLGLQTPTSAVQHDAANGFGGFTSLIFNLDPQDQLRFVAQARRDFYQVPIDPSDV